MAKELKHRGKTCPDGTYQVFYTDQNLPYLKCDKCDKEIKDWIQWEETYKTFWQDPEKTASKKDLPMSVLGSFCHKYNTQYGFPYPLSLNERGLFLGQEISIIRRIIAHLPTYQEIEEYFVWFFAEKCVKRRKKLTSISVLAAPQTLGEFKLARERSRTVWRDKPLPPKMKEWIENNAPSVAELNLTDFGDLKTFLTGFRKGQYGQADATGFVDRLKEKGIVAETLDINRWSER